MTRVLVRGVGDIGSAVAHRLFTSGHAVVIHDEPAPATTRRGMAFADALFDGRATLEGIDAVIVRDLDQLPALLATPTMIPAIVDDFTAVLTTVVPDILIDARMRKRAHPGVQRGLAKLTIGLGPNFVAGETTDVVVETSWEALGRVVAEGASLPFRGEPRALGGHGRDRYVYAPGDGIFRTTLEIGDTVARGDVVARIGAWALTAPLDGMLRGLTRDGVRVTAGTKVIEVDPRGAAAEIRGIGERPRRIAEAVLRVIRERRGRPYRMIWVPR
jgi:xanthine dehydrogenase accessory factor